MKVFISWSGERSKKVALALREWLPNVIQSIEPWMSDADIRAGEQWNTALFKQLNDTSIEIICLTKDNYNEPYILFEAGALAKTVDKEPLVCPYLIDHTLKEFQSLPAPLTQFQAKKASEKGTWELIQALNKLLDKNQLRQDRLKKAFELWWPYLKSTLDAIIPIDGIGINPQIRGSSFFISKFNKDFNLKVLELNKNAREYEDEKLNLTWETFGKGCEHLVARLKEAPGEFSPDIIFGINTAGIMTAAYLSNFFRAHLGIIKTDIEIHGRRSIKQVEFPNNEVKLNDNTTIESLIVSNPRCIAIVDSEIKSGKSGRYIIDLLENKYKNAKIIYIVLGGVVKTYDRNRLTINDFGWSVPKKYKPDFLAFYIDLPGFEPPGGIR